MNRKVIAAVGSAAVSVVIALGAGFGVASATEPAPPSGGTCNNYGNNNIIIAPNCGTAPASPSTVTSVRTETRTVTAVPDPRLCPAIYPTPPGCPGYNPNNPGVPLPVQIPN